MFTGIVEECGRVISREPVETGARFRVSASFAPELALGESVAVNGCCLTVVATSAADNGVTFDLLEETLRLTNLGDLEEGSLVNLERALKVGDRLSGHFVQGHVDTTAELLALDSSGQDHRLDIALPDPEYSRYMVAKGSICIDGMSLTIAELQEDRFTIWITPHTYAVTNLAGVRPGHWVNLEVDMIAKYLERLGRA